MKLKEMIGNKFLHMGKEVHIVNMENKEDDLYLVEFSSGETKNISEEELVKDFMPITTSSGKSLAIVNGLQIENSSLQDLTTILMDSIKKVQGDPEYVKQASSINDSAKQIIEIKKTQLEMVKLIKDL